MSKLYEVGQELAEQLEEFLAWAEENGVDEQVITETAESMKAEFVDGAEDIVKAMKNYEAAATAKKEEAKRLNERAANDLKKVENIQHFLDISMKAANLDKLNAGVFELKYKKGSVVTEVDPDKLPDQYFTQQIIFKPLPKPDLKKMVDSGRKIPGVQVIQNPPKLVIK